MRMMEPMESPDDLEPGGGDGVGVPPQAAWQAAWVGYVPPGSYALVRRAWRVFGGEMSRGTEGGPS